MTKILEMGFENMLGYTILTPLHSIYMFISNKYFLRWSKVKAITDVYRL